MSTIKIFLLALLLALAVPTLASAQVDLNSADAKTLAESMTGVGLVKAEAIVAYRNTHGPFKSVEDLSKVKGIGAKTIEANRNAVVIVEHKDGAQSDGGSAGKPFAVR